MYIDFYDNSTKLEGINWANIILITEVDAPTSTSNFYPISPINSPLKIILRIASKLHKVIN